MLPQTIRVGLVGAGNNTRVRHVPGFRSIPGVELVSVANRTPESSARAAREFGIPGTHARWQDLVADPKIDAVCIGTWPNLHCEVTCAALAAGKHVLCEARMARNLAEARTMLKASQAAPHLISQLVPSPFGLEYVDFIIEQIAHHYVGELREVVVIGGDDAMWDDSQLLHWRQDAEISGVNTLSLGILHETVMRWIPPIRRVYAQTATFSSPRPCPTSQARVPATVPDCVYAVAEAENNVRVLYQFSGVQLFGPGKQIVLYGRQGTIKLVCGVTDELWCGRIGDPALHRVSLPAEKRRSWRAEADFIAAIRGGEKPRFTDFETGVRYMEFTEAVSRSGRTKQPVELPLVD
jgi:predicted dehydrogenase